MSSELQTGKADSPYSSKVTDEEMALDASIDGDRGAIPLVVAPHGDGWLKYRIEDVADVKSGKRLPQGHVLVDDKTAYPYIRLVDVSDGKIQKNNLKYLTEEARDGIKRYIVNQGDVCLAIVGHTIGMIFYVGSEWDGVNLTENAARLTSFRSEINSRYLYYFLMSPVGQAAIISRKVGSAQGKLPLYNIKSLEFFAPSKIEQNSIVEFLDALSNRVDLLRETNATLEAMAQVLFKSWFVDFDPVHANAGTRAATLPTELQALFPSTFTDTPQGLVPEGWQVGVVGDVAQQKKGSINPMQAPERLFEHYSLPAFDSNQVPVLEQGEKIKSNKTPLPPNAVLLSKLNPHIPRVWLPFGYADSAVCSTEFLVYSPINGASKEFIYALFTSVNFLMNLQQLVTGTSNSHQRVKPDHVIGLELVIPSQGILAEFENAVKPLFERIGHNRQQAQTLAKLRDTLLPRLISGQLRLPDAAAALAEAGA